MRSHWLLGEVRILEKEHIPKLYVAYFRWVIQKARRERGLSDDLGELVREYEQILPEYAEKLKWLIGFSEEETQEKSDERCQDRDHGRTSQ